MRRICATKKYTIPQIAAMFARSDCWVYQHLSLTDLDQRVVAMMDYSLPFESRLKFAIAILLATLPKELQFEIAKYIVDNKMRMKAARHYVEVKAAEKNYRVGGIASRPERRRNSLTSLLVMVAESLPTFLNVPDTTLEDFLLSFPEADLTKLEELAKQCHQGLKELYDAVKPALVEVRADNRRNRQSHKGLT